MKLTHGYNMARIVTEITEKLFWGLVASTTFGIHQPRMMIPRFMVGEITLVQVKGNTLA